MASSNRPLRVPIWATGPEDPEAQIVAPDNLRQAEGFSAGKKPPAPVFNWLHNRAGNWLQFLRHMDVKNWIPGQLPFPILVGDKPLEGSRIPQDIVFSAGSFYCAVNVQSGESAGYVLLRSRDGLNWESPAVGAVYAAAATDQPADDPQRIVAMGAAESKSEIAIAVRLPGDNTAGGLKKQRAIVRTPSGFSTIGSAVRDIFWIGYSEYHEKWLVLSNNQSGGGVAYYHDEDPGTAMVGLSASQILDSVSGGANGFKPTAINENPVTGLLVAVGKAGSDSVIATSTNVTAWTERTVPEGGIVGRNAWYDPTDELWMCGNMSSLDGITWEVMPNAPELSTDFPEYRYIQSDGRGVWVLTRSKQSSSRQGTFRAAFSENRGTSWQTACEAPAAGGTRHRMAYGNDRWCIAMPDFTLGSLRTCDANALLASGEGQASDSGSVVPEEPPVIVQEVRGAVYEYYGPAEPADYDGFGGNPTPVPNVFALSWRSGASADGIPRFSVTQQPKSGQAPGTATSDMMRQGGTIRLTPTATPSAAIDLTVFAQGGDPWWDPYIGWVVLDARCTGVAWDASLVSNEFRRTKSLAALLGTSVRSIHIDRGTRLNALVLAGTTLYHLSLGEPGSLESCQIAGAIDLSGQDSEPRAAVWNEFGNRILWVGATNNALRLLTMPGRALNLSEAVDSGVSFPLASYGSDPVGLGLSRDDKYAFVLFNSNNSIVQFEFATYGTLTGLDDVNTPLDIGTLTGETTPTCMAVEGKHVYVFGSVNDQIHHIELDDEEDISTGALVASSADLEAIDNAINGLAVAPDGTKLYAIGDQNNVALEFLLLPLTIGDDYAIEFIPHEVRPRYALIDDGAIGTYGGTSATIPKQFFAPNAVTNIKLHYAWGATAGELSDEADDIDGVGWLQVMVQTNNGSVTRIAYGTPAAVSGFVSQTEAAQGLQASISSGNLVAHTANSEFWDLDAGAAIGFVELEVESVFRRGRMDA